MYKKAVRHNKKLSKIVFRSGSLGFGKSNRGFSLSPYHKDFPSSVLGFFLHDLDLYLLEEIIHY